MTERVALHQEAREMGLLSRTIVDARRSGLRLKHKTRVKHGDIVCDAKNMEEHGLNWWELYKEPMNIHIKAWLEPTTWVEIGPATLFKGGKAERLILTDGTILPEVNCIEYTGFLHGGMGGGISRRKDDKLAYFRDSLKDILHRLREELMSRVKTDCQDTVATL